MEKSVEKPVPVISKGTGASTIKSGQIGKVTPMEVPKPIAAKEASSEELDDSGSDEPLEDAQNSK